MKFGTIDLPHGQTHSKTEASFYASKFEPGQEQSYNELVGSDGEDIGVTGWLWGEDRETERVALKALADGTARTFDDEMGNLTFTGLMVQIIFTYDVKKPYRIGYSCRILEKDDP